MKPSTIYLLTAFLFSSSSFSMTGTTKQSVNINSISGAPILTPNEIAAYIGSEDSNGSSVEDFCKNETIHGLNTAQQKDARLLFCESPLVH